MLFAIQYFCLNSKIEIIYNPLNHIENHIANSHKPQQHVTINKNLQYFSMMFAS